MVFYMESTKSFFSKMKKNAGVFLFALLGGAVAAFSYQRVFDNKPGVIVQDALPVHLAGLSQAGANDFTVAAERTVHAVVHVRVKGTQNQVINPFYEFFYGRQFQQQEPVSGFGSGVILSSDGYIITNNHVVENASEISVKLNDNREFVAELIGRDPSTDLALLKIKAKDLSYITFGSSENLKVGEWVLAVGNPFNLTSTVTAGIVSAKGRNLNILNDQYKIESFIQTDAALNPGNSGGALVNVAGELVGVNAAIVSPSGGYAGNSFAIPSSIVKKVYEDLKEFGVVQRAVLGVSIQDVNADIAREKNMDKISGVNITGVQDDGAAKEAGIKEGDIIVGVNNVAVTNTAELQEQISKFRPNQKATISILRDNKPLTFDVTLKNVKGDTQLVKSEVNLSVLGAKFGEVSPSELKKLRIQNGVKVTEVSAGKFRKAGIEPNFIITSINEKPVSTPADIEKVISSSSDGVYIKGIYPDGVIAYYAFGMD
jgi:Do/DeqQ family serine protease